MAKYKNITKLPIRFTLNGVAKTPVEVCMGEGDMAELPEGNKYVESLVNKKYIEKVIDPPTKKI